MPNFKDKTALMWDAGGLGVEHAVSLSKSFGKVIYYTPYQAAFCESKDYFLGRGFEGVRKTLYFHDELPKADIIIFGDIGQGDLANQLRKEEKLVFGAGDGEKFENHRFPFRVLQKSLGLPTQKTKECIGVDDLIAYLKANPNQWVKVDNPFRGDCESFFSKTYDDVKGKIDKAIVDFGPYSDGGPDAVRFVVEEDVKTDVQVGIDAFFYGDWVRPCLYGFEHGRAYIGTFADKLAPFFEDFMAKMKGPMEKRKYRGCFSSEHRAISIDKAYMIDPTTRPPYNLSVGYGEWITNFDEIVWKVASGEKVTLKPRAKYVGGAPIYTDAEDHWVKWVFPKRLREEGKIKFRECAKKDGAYWAIKKCNSAAFIISWGDSPERVIKDIKKNAELVDCDGCDKHKIRDLDDALIEIRKARSMGISF